MAEKRVIKMGSGDYRETNVTDNATYVEGDYYNNSEPKQSLTEIAQEITDLLTYFENNNPSISEAMTEVNAIKQRQPQIEDQEIIVEAIESSPTLKQRIHSAGKTLYLETVKALLPAVGVAIETVNAWKNPE